MGYKEDIELDIYDLHNEYAKQPSRYMKWAEKYADAVEAAMLAKQNLDKVKTETKQAIEECRATLDGDIRSNPGRYSLDSDKKPSENAIANAIVLCKSYKENLAMAAAALEEATLAYIAAVKDQELIGGAKEALYQRKDAIEGEIKLWLGGYYSDPKIPKPYQEAQAQEAQLKMNEYLNRRRRKAGEA